MQTTLPNRKKKGTASTIVDVAQAADVSYSVAADILRETTRYSYKAETIDRVKQIANELAYRPNRTAQALTSGRTQQIALCLRSMGTSFHHQMIRAFELVLGDSDYDLLIIPHHRLEREISADGFLFYGSAEHARPLMSQPLVVMGAYSAESIPRTLECDFVSLDLAAAMRLGVEDFISKGCRRILFVGPEPMIEFKDDRYVAYSSAVLQAGLKPENLGLEFDDSQSPNPSSDITERASTKLEQYFEKYGFPNALCCTNDDIAIGTYRALRKTGRLIPQQTMVMGCDDIDVARDLTPTLTSIQIPYEAMAQNAWQLLQQRLQDPEQPKQKTAFAAELVIRDSSSCVDTPSNDIVFSLRESLSTRRNK